ncbi:hypothetical protein ACIOJE_11170 [Kitasatospora sp. NPDC087861]|uniref:hypothetical protein n=1 Tax=Kitasatospora sp. NPDC087861 TaxID=3364070 RepID=UPI0038006592
MIAHPVEVWRLSEEDRRAGRRAVAWTVGPGGDLAVLLVPEQHLEPAGSWPPVRLPFDGEVVVADPRGARRVPLSGAEVPPDHLALLPGNRMLLAGYRAEQVGSDWRTNAAVYGADGTRTAELVLGDDVRP